MSIILRRLANSEHFYMNTEKSILYQCKFITENIRLMVSVVSLFVVVGLSPNCIYYTEFIKKWIDTWFKKGRITNKKTKGLVNNPTFLVYFGHLHYFLYICIGKIYTL